MQYGITVTVAVLLSLLEALTLTPMRCSRYLTISHNPSGLARFVDNIFQKLSATYQRVLVILLNHRWKTIAATLIFFAMSLVVKRFIPSRNDPQRKISLNFSYALSFPWEPRYRVTDSKIKQVEDFLLKVPEVNGIFSAVGGFGGDAVNQGMAFANLVDKDKRKISQGDLVKKLRGPIEKSCARNGNRRAGSFAAWFCGHPGFPCGVRRPRSRLG